MNGAVPQRGFTLIELLITLAVLSVLATLVVPVAQLQAQRQREVELRLALREIRHALDAYKKAGDEGRIARDASGSGYPPALNVLVEGMEDRRDPRRGRLVFLRRVPRDPFHADASVEAAQTWGLRAYGSEAHDLRPGADVYDVHTQSPMLGLNGVPLKDW